MHVIFCRPRCPHEQEDGFELEADVLETMGVEPLWIEMEAVVDGGLDRVLDAMPEGGGAALLRSWMLREEEYAELFEGLADRGYVLVNNATAYANAHYLPNVYAAIEPWTAPTRWTEGDDPEEAWTLAQELGPGPYMLKDHVKSAKEDWTCGRIPAGCDKATFLDHCERLIDFRGERFERGIVVRSMLPLVPLRQTRGDAPCFDEVRLFFWRGEVVASAPYFDVDRGPGEVPQFEFLADRIDSEFFSVDIARLTSGEWKVLEVGDGGVSVLPPLMDPRAFYERIVGAPGGWM